MACMSGGALSENDAYGWFVAYETLTENLCLIMQALEEHDLTGYIPSDQLAWWYAHQKKDRERLKEEIKQTKRKKDRDILIDSLSEYERGLLSV